MRALNGSDVRREIIPLLWSTVKRRSLFVVFQTCASLSSCLCNHLPWPDVPVLPSASCETDVNHGDGGAEAEARSRGEDDAMTTGNWMSDPCR